MDLTDACSSLDEGCPPPDDPALRLPDALRDFESLSAEDAAGIGL
ncbi:MAG: hypothetical protein ACOY37_01770 [Pseudomonadota bacterium]